MSKLSIITPTYNCEKYIEDCILSIKNQTNLNYEHIIVDGGSTDATLDIVKHYSGTYNMRWITEPDNGMYDAICKGFSIATGDILAWLNADDMYRPYTVNMVINIMSNPDILWLTGYPVIYTENGVMYSANTILPIPFRFFMKIGYPGKGGCGFQQESTFWKKSLWESANGSAIRKYKYAGDILLWKKFAHHSDIYITDVILSGFRKHPGQKSEDKISYNRERGKWSVINIFLKIFHIPEFCSNIYALHGGKRLIRLKNLV
ncbi:glycosyltransferase family 2 protein [Diplocloster hominis]|uniref:glycosyltransferase family 2 protein n=1 Tax=Diplocloster hominis TaxID=3079010 RepID=UPI0031BABE8D